MSVTLTITLLIILIVAVYINGKSLMTLWVVVKGMCDGAKRTTRYELERFAIMTVLICIFVV